jgi:hypothetical protein
MGVMVRGRDGIYEGRIQRMPTPPEGEFEERVRR